MSEFWHKLGCCVVEKPQPKKKRRRIDRTMIGEPMNFVHLTHIGSGEMGAGDGLAMTGVFSVMDMYYAVAFLLSGGGAPAVVALGKGGREKQ